MKYILRYFISYNSFAYFFHGLTTLDLLIDEVSRSHSNTQHLVGLFWTSDRVVAETSLPNETQVSQDTDIQANGGIRTRCPSKREASEHALNRAATRIGSWYMYWI